MSPCWLAGRAGGLQPPPYKSGPGVEQQHLRRGTAPASRAPEARDFVEPGKNGPKASSTLGKSSDLRFWLRRSRLLEDGNRVGQASPKRVGPDHQRLNRDEFPSVRANRLEGSFQTMKAAG